MANFYYLVAGLSVNGTAIPFDSVEWDPEIEKMLKQSGARSGYSFTGVATGAPVCRITSPALASVLDITGLNAAAVTAFEVHLLKYGPTGVESGSVHRKATMTGGVIRMASIEARKNGAEIMVEVHGNYDGSNASWVIVDNAAAPTDTVVDEVFYLGPLFIGTTEYHLESCTFTGGGEVVKKHSQGDTWPTLVAVKPPRPSFRVGTFDGVLATAAGAMGANVADLELFFRKGDEGAGLRVADATLEHIQIVIPSAYLSPAPVSGTPGVEVDFELMFDIRDDGTNAITTLDTTAAIATPV